jgi:hypothetical protein
MNRPQLGILLLLVVGLAAMVAFPPYFGMDVTSDGRIHGFLGYHPAWDPPSQEGAYAILLDDGLVPASGVQASNLAVRTNVIRMALNALAFVILCLVGVRLLRRPGGVG